MSRKYKFHNPDGVYFVTFAVQGWVDVFTNPLLCARQQLQKAEEGVAHIYTTLGITATVTPGSTTFMAVPAFIQQAAEPEQYYFHPDHLGSSNYITNIDGTVSQHMEYFAFGETFVEEHKNSHNSPYKYNGKELDEETGWYYYGARYYDPKISLWLSVDPLAEKYPSWSPYNYCMDNPIRMIDPDGMGPWDFIKALSKSVNAAITVGLQAGFEATAGNKPLVSAAGHYGTKDLIGFRDGAVTHIAQDNAPTSYGTSIGFGSFGTSTTAVVTKETKKEQFKIPGTNTTIYRELEVEKGTVTTSVSANVFSAGVQQSAEITTDKTTGQKDTKVSEAKPQFDVDLGSKLNLKVSAILGIDLSIDLNKIVKAFDELK